MNKRLLVRLSAIVGSLAIGSVGVYQSLRTTDEAAAEPAAEVAVAAPEAAEGEVAQATMKPPVASDPFAAVRSGSSASKETIEPVRWSQTDRGLPIHSSQVVLSSGEEAAPEAAPAPEEAPAGDPFAKARSSGSSSFPVDSHADHDHGSPGEGEPSAAAEQPGFAGGFPRDAAAATESTVSEQPTAEAEMPQRMSRRGFPRDGSDGAAVPDASLVKTDPKPFPSAREPAADTGAVTDTAEPTEGRARRRIRTAPPVAEPTVDEMSGGPLAAQAQEMSSQPQEMPQESGALASGGGRPGDKALEGMQTSQITVEKIAPREIQVGKPAVFQVKIRNAANVVAQAVEVHDEVPAGTQLISTSPETTGGADGRIVWSLGDLQPGAEIVAQMEVMPMQEGEIGSVASVMYRADASVRTIATKPELTLTVSAPAQVMINEPVNLSVTISNPGTGAATGVIITERVPDGLKHAAGAELEFEVGVLRPGETRKLDLTLEAAQAGQLVNVLSARGDANLQAEEQTPIQVIAPALQVSMEGPTKRYLDRPATYTVSVSNPGTAPAKDVELVTHLSKGLKFIKADNAGQYDAQRHTVVWSLEELPAAETGSVTLTAMPIEAGEQKLRTEGKANQGLTDEKEQLVQVEGLAALYFEVVDVEDPVEVGGETVYEIRVINQGSKACTNVRVGAELPPSMKPLSAEGPSRHTLEGQQVVFAPLTRLAPKADTTYRIRVQGLEAGNHRIAVQVASDEIREPVTKEESTRIYADE